MQRPEKSLTAGASVVQGATRFRVWAPEKRSVYVAINGGSHELADEGGGWFSGVVKGCEPGSRYEFRLDGGKGLPDPVSRFQPEGPHGPSEVIDPTRFRWTDAGWRGVSLRQAVIYEMHVGTFTEGGTWESALERLPALKETGITVLELMPVADFSGRFGWGYDGVNLYAPTRLYGRPDDMRRFVDTAHSMGMAVILDVVYNHLGADGNYLSEFSRDYFSTKYTTDWGDAINFDGPNAGPVRDYFADNAAYWIREFHLDGLRIDATQNIYDETDPHILSVITQRVRDAAGGRTTLVIAENEPQETNLVRDADRGGYGMDGLWNDDYHHTAVVALTGRNEAYYTDYCGSPQEFVSAAKYGYIYQGQRYKWQKNRRGTSTRGIRPSAFVTFIENHDQVANSARGDRMHALTSPGLLKAITTLLLLGPGTPMLFQGQEFGSSKRFQYFADVPPDLAKLVREGRREFVSQWRSIRMPEMLGCMEDPCSEATFVSSKLDWSERGKNERTVRLHADLLRLRREDPVYSSWDDVEYDGAVLSQSAFCLRAFSDEHGDRLLMVNLGMDLHLDPAPEPLLAPPDGCVWDVMFSTEHPKYGGCGTAPLDTEENWRIPGRAAVALRPMPAPKEEEKKA